LTLPATATPEPNVPHRVWRLARPGWARRVYGLFMRNVYLLMGSPPRVVDLFYWQALNMITWGFMNFYLLKQTSGVGFIAGSLLGATILWDVMLRTQINVMRPFLEELYARNIGSVFVSPLSPKEFALGVILIASARILVAMIPCIILANLIFHFWLPGLGWPLAGFWINLSMAGWWGGFIMIALLLRFGMAAEWLAWMLTFALSPIVGIYYPVDVLPETLQRIAWFFPHTYVFEGLRALMNGHPVRWDYMAMAFGLNLVFLGGSIALFLAMFRRAKRGSGLLQVAE
jgi:ABC-2 type transport system permease protein